MDCSSYSYTANGFGCDVVRIAKYDDFANTGMIAQIDVYDGKRYIVGADNYDNVSVYEEFNNETAARELYNYLTTNKKIDGRKLNAVIRRLHKA